VGRPHKPIDATVVKNLAKIGCTLEEIASVVECSVDTLDRRFKQVIRSGWQHCNASLRRKQYEIAMSAQPIQGQVTMLIWLGKQRLGQRDGMAAQQDSSDRLDEMLNAMQAGPTERGKVNL
jgi:hypothetical protein